MVVNAQSPAEKVSAGESADRAEKPCAQPSGVRGDAAYLERGAELPSPDRAQLEAVARVLFSLPVSDGCARTAGEIFALCEDAAHALLTLGRYARCVNLTLCELADRIEARR